jgi:hypothetical protein
MYGRWIALGKLLPCPKPGTLMSSAIYVLLWNALEMSASLKCGIYLLGSAFERFKAQVKGLGYHMVW